MPDWLMMLGATLFLAAGIAYTVTTVQASSKTRSILETLGVDNTAGLESVVDDMIIVASCFLAGSTVVLGANLFCSGLVARFFRKFSQHPVDDGLLHIDARQDRAERNSRWCCSFAARMVVRPSPILPASLEFVTAVILILIVLLAALTAAWIVATSVVNIGAKSALQFWEYGSSVFNDAPESSFEELYSEVVGSSVDTITMEDWEDFASRYNISETVQARFAEELSVPSNLFNGTQADVCPTNLCIDLSLYSWIDSDMCFCDPLEIQKVRDLSLSARNRLIISLLSTFFMSLGGACLLASLNGNVVGLYIYARFNRALQDCKSIEADSS